MATRPAADIAEPVVAGEIIILDPAGIVIGERLRPIDRVHAEGLGWSMVKDGQISPIEVCRMPGKTEWHLAGPGGHRLTGAIIVGMDGIEARPVSSGRVSRRRREAVENLFRSNLDPIDRAAAIAELVSLKRDEAGLHVVAGRDAMAKGNLRREAQAETDETLETISRVYGWSDELGAELGFSGRTIRNDLMLYRGLRPSLVTRLRERRHPVLANGTQLRALAKLDSVDQDTVVTLMLRDRPEKPAVKTVAAAIAQMRGSNQPIDPDAKRLSAFIGAFARMSLAEKKGALVQLAGMLPAGFTLSDGGAA